MTEDELVAEIKQCVHRLNELSHVAGKMGIEFEFEDTLHTYHKTEATIRIVTIKKRLT